ncbi:helix-turn-helix domain-containing protein [Priestia megaterium]|uniref:XRE family transcriptional regulator n=1 Tax=Priestia megaterium TaxID=1404 RepID=A0A6M6E2P9_PRIMG|nr:helix-turn-helix transcriptional regulator [Priestia megaterium]QJX80006.1 hypothetical protein FDZ14_28290 [Priestia megaterium]
MIKQMDKVTQGRTIRERHKKLGITQEVLAAELSCEKRLISMCERGFMELQSDKLEKIKEILELE